VGVHAALGFGLEHPVIGLKPRGLFVHVNHAAAVGYGNTVCGLAFHKQSLLRERLRDFLDVIEAVLVADGMHAIAIPAQACSAMMAFSM
jgi:hypothetical protein